MFANSTRAESSQSGFSLVEVALAIGIATFSLLVIFSLVPAGLATLHDATMQIVETEIFNKIGAELASTPFYDDVARTNDLLASYQASRFPAYFDFEGNELTGADIAKAVFTVECALAAPTTLSGEIRLATVRIGFHRDPGQADTATIKADKRTFVLANKGNQ